MFTRSLLLATMISIAATASGCLPMMIGSLGYQAYKYEKTGKIAGMPTSSARASSRHAKAARSRPDDSQIE